MGSSDSIDLDCSIVVPMYNEAATLAELHDRLTKTMKLTGLSYELVFVDDGSTDQTLPLLKDLAQNDPNTVVVELRRNFGQTPALAAGFDVACGRIVVSMDGDLQHVPEEIPNFIEKINEGYDLVSGWRKQRLDNLATRRIPSRVANWTASKISGLEIHDFGTTFKAYRGELLRELNLYGELHRFIPALLAQTGIRIVEIPIKNIPRQTGVSNYGISRTFGVVWDLLTIKFLLGYFTRPMQFFGRGAAFCILAALLMGAYILYDKIVYSVPVSVAHAPMAGLAAVLLLVGLILISTGLIGEMLSRVYFESTGSKIYSVRKIHRKTD